MKHFVCVDIVCATPMSIGGECPTPCCEGYVRTMDLHHWKYDCSDCCNHELPSRIAFVDVRVEYISRPVKEANEDAGRSA